MIATLQTAVRRHPIAAFVLLAYVFSWWPWPLYSLDLSPAALVGFGPFLAALVILGLTGGRPAVKSLFGQMVRWRVDLRWYVLALGLPILMIGSASTLNVLLGAPAPGPEQLRQWPSILPSFFLLLLIPGIGGAWEEPGWRGFALPKLASRRSQLAACLPLAVMWAGWHLPLFLNGIIPWADLVHIPGMVVIFSWVYYGAGRSVLIIMIFHAMNNAAGQYFPALFPDGYVARLALLHGLVVSLVALLVIVVQRRFWASRLDSRSLGAPQLARQPTNRAAAGVSPTRGS